MGYKINSIGHNDYYQIINDEDRLSGPIAECVDRNDAKRISEALTILDWLQEKYEIDTFEYFYGTISHNALKQLLVNPDRHET